MSVLQDDIRLDAWRGVFEKLDRILSEQKVRVHVVPDAEVPHHVTDVAGWSDGLNVYLNGRMVREMLASNDKLAAVLRLKGLNYHELCHILFTPRQSDELVRRIQAKVQDTGDSTWWYAFNALEDQRIETWFTATYGASRRYFEATILEWIIKNGNAESAVLVYGRKYLTPRIRVQAGRAFKKKYGVPLYADFQNVIDEYVTLVLPDDSVRAYLLMTRYHDLLMKMKQMHNAGLPKLVIEDNGGATGTGHGGRGDTTTCRAGRVLVKAARKAGERAQEAVEDALDADAEEEAKRDAEKGRADAESEKSQDEASEAGADGESGGEQGDQPGSGTAGAVGASKSPQGSEAAGGGIGGEGSTDDHIGDESDRSVLDEIKDMVDEAHADMDEVREDEWVQDDVDSILDAVGAAENNGKMNAAGRAAKAGTVPPSDQANLAVRRVHTILTRIRQEAEPETLRRQLHGRMDPRRAAIRRSHEVDFFKSWDHGNEEETGVESVILVDVSGSMGGYTLTHAAEATWALKRAFDKLDIRTTVMMYDTDHWVLYQPGEKAAPGGVPILRGGGSTDPTTALIQAQRVLVKSNAPNKVLITVTDGGWWGDEAHFAKIMKPLHKIGVHSMILGLNHAVQHHGKHSHQEGHDITTVSELPKAAVKLVANIMRAVQV